MGIAQLTIDVEEVSAFYAAKNDIDRTDDWLVLKLNEEVGELTQAHLAKQGQSREKGRTVEERDADFRAELADVLSQVLLIANRHGVDLEREVTEKWLAWRPQAPASPAG